MTDDQNETGDEPGFDDPSYAGVRDLLAGARVTDPIPAEVAARLDATLASLTPGMVPDATHVVTPLRRRPRRAPRLLAAAAAVIVVGAGGVGVAQVLRDGSGGNDTLSAADSGAAKSAQEPAANADNTTLIPESALSDGTDTASGSLDGLVAVPTLTTANFSADAAEFDDARLRSLQRTSYDAAAPIPSATTSTKSPLVVPQSGPVATAGRNLSLKACPGPQMSGTSSYPILLDRDPAVLVLHPVNAASQLVEAWSCDGTAVLAFASVPR